MPNIVIVEGNSSWRVRIAEDLRGSDYRVVAMYETALELYKQMGNLRGITAVVIGGNLAPEDASGNAQGQKLAEAIRENYGGAVKTVQWSAQPRGWADESANKMGSKHSLLSALGRACAPARQPTPVRKH